MPGPEPKYARPVPGAERNGTGLGTRARWVISKSVDPSLFAKFPELDPVLVQLLYNRGLTTQAEIDSFLKPEYSEDVIDPFTFPQMERAVERVIKAIKSKERIVVYGDYDADGVCGSAVLFTTLQKLGADPAIRIPYRHTEGYGLNLAAVQELHDDGYTLCITNDCGITSQDEIALANKLGMDVIISDHHHGPKEIPDAYAILNPNVQTEPYPFKFLSGTGVSFKLATALLIRSEYGKKLKQDIPVGWEKWLLDLVAIGTVADMMPLIGENRTLVAYGLQVLKKTPRLGLKALFEIIGTAADQAESETIGFQIAPRLNAAGRLNHANSAFRLLVTDDAKEAQVIAQDLDQTNRERQRLTETVVQAAKDQIGAVGDKLLVAGYSADWPNGVLGLAAGRLVNFYNRPAILMADSNGETSGSGRSIPALNIIEAIEQVSSYLKKFGGHSGACGFTLNKAEEREAFVAALSNVIEKTLAGVSLQPELKVDVKLGLDQITWELLDSVEQLAPFGQKAQRPVFAVDDIEVHEASTIGRDNRHLRLTVRSANGTIQRTIGFSFGEELPKLPMGRKIAIAFELGADEWNGERRLQLKLIDVHYA